MHDSSDSYADIIDMPRRVSSKHPRMPMSDRAAQFASFKALSGYEQALQEAGRTAEEREAPRDRALLELKLRILGQNVACMPEVSVTYFVPDERKGGGKYLTVSGQVSRVDETRALLVFADGRSVPAGAITDIRGEIFETFQEMEI